ncbi:ankyrin repeat domain-containing protein [bacterium]|nr:MAG: ankyrin repeat domain-containing protein [bacterium]
MSKKNTLLQITLFVTLIITNSILPASQATSTKTCYDTYISLNKQGISRRVLGRAVELAKKNKLNSLHIQALTDYQNPQDILAVLIIDHQTPVDVQDINGCTALHVAAMYNNVTCARALVQEHHANLNALNNDGKTPERLAQEHGHIDLANYLRAQRDEQEIL